MTAEDSALPLLEFWPDYGAGPLWKAGSAADLDRLDMPPELVDRLRAFNAAYDEQRLPIEGEGDAGYLAEGARLLARAQTALDGRFHVAVAEPWWGEAPSAYEW